MLQRPFGLTDDAAGESGATPFTLANGRRFDSGSLAATSETSISIGVGRVEEEEEGAGSGLANALSRAFAI